MKPEEAARFLGVNGQFIRLGLRQGVFPWGYAVKGVGGRYSYFINEKKFFETEKIERGTNETDERSI